MPDNDHLTAAIYARVSSEQQAKEQTIASQVEALRRRAQDDGLTLPEELCFLDEGASGGTLLRPALIPLPPPSTPAPRRNSRRRTKRSPARSRPCAGASTTTA